MHVVIFISAKFIQIGCLIKRIIVLYPFFFAPYLLLILIFDMLCSFNERINHSN